MRIKIIFLLFVTSYLSLVTPVYAHSTIQIVEMVEDGFEPQTVTLDQNSTVLFLNKDKVDRWPASNIHPTHDVYPEFDPQKSIPPGSSWAFKPKKTGEWKFHDHLLPHFRVSIIIEVEKEFSAEVKSGEEKEGENI